MPFCESEDYRIMMKKKEIRTTISLFNTNTTAIYRKTDEDRFSAISFEGNSARKPASSSAKLRRESDAVRSIRSINNDSTAEISMRKSQIFDIKPILYEKSHVLSEVVEAISDSVKESTKR